jgi:hypothetical protein
MRSASKTAVKPGASALLTVRTRHLLGSLGATVSFLTGSLVRPAPDFVGTSDLVEITGHWNPGQAV